MLAPGEHKISVKTLPNYLFSDPFSNGASEQVKSLLQNLINPLKNVTTFAYSPSTLFTIPQKSLI